MTIKIFLINIINILNASTSISIEHSFYNFKFAECSLGLSPFINSNKELIGNVLIQSNYFEHINLFASTEYSRSKSLNLIAGLNLSYSRFDILIGYHLKKTFYLQIKAKLINRKYEILDKFSIAYTFSKNDTKSKPDKTILLQQNNGSTTAINQSVLRKKNRKLKSSTKKTLASKITEEQNSQAAKKTKLQASSYAPLSEHGKTKIEARKIQLINELFECKEIIYLYSNTIRKKATAIKIFGTMTEQLNLFKKMDSSINYIYFNQKNKPFNNKIIENQTAKKEWNEAMKRLNKVTNHGKNQEQALHSIFYNFSKLMDHSVNTEDQKILSAIKNNKNFKHIYFGTETKIKRLNERKKTDIKDTIYKILRECLSKMRELNTIYEQEEKKKYT